VIIDYIDKATRGNAAASCQRFRILYGSGGAN
jgi:hypothetical protein